MFRGRRTCAFSLVPTRLSTQLSPCNFLYRLRPCFNLAVFLDFPTRTVSRTDPSSLYPLSLLSLTIPYRKNRGRGEGAPSFSPFATRHSSLATSPNSFRCHSYENNPGGGSIKSANTTAQIWN